MPRAKGGSKTRSAGRKFSSRRRATSGGRRRLYRTAAETVLRAGAFAYRGASRRSGGARAVDHPRERRLPPLGLSYSGS
jgi:ribosomal protein L20